jgi:hypothetical protein
MTILRTNLIQTTSGKTLLDSSGSIIAVTTFTNDTRTVLSASTDYTLWSPGLVIKKSSNSKLIIVGNLPFRGGYSYFQGEWWRIGSSGKRYDGITLKAYNSNAGDRSVQFGMFIHAEYVTSEVGQLAISIGWTSANGNSDYPAAQWNPSSVDDPRSRQKVSTLTLIEVVT